MAEDDTDVEESTEETFEHDGRSAKIDTGFYSVRVWGDVEDDLEDVTETLMEVAERARQDVVELEGRMSDGDRYVE